MQVCQAESHGNPAAIGDGHTAHVSVGLFQIRTLPGRPSIEKLKDPQFNVGYAYDLWKSEGWNPWSVCSGKVECD